MESSKKRINVKKIVSLEEMINKPFSKVIIELKENFNLSEIKDILSMKGNTEINLIIKKNQKKAYYSLQSLRKFDLKHLKALKTKEYVSKITV